MVARCKHEMIFFGMRHEIVLAQLKKVFRACLEMWFNLYFKKI